MESDAPLTPAPTSQKPARRMQLQVAQFQKELDLQVAQLAKCKDTHETVVTLAKKEHEKATAHYEKAKKKLDDIHVDLGKWKYAELKKAEHNAKDAEKLLK